MNYNYPYSILLLFVFVLVSCQNEPKEEKRGEDIRIRLVEEPDRINPILSKSSLATQIENHIFLPLMEFEPESLTFEPLLIANEPKIDNFRKGKSFSFEIREDAVWEDGKPITGEDYLFTVKAAINPHSQARVWRGFLSEIDSIWIDPSNSKKFTVFIDDAFHLALETAANFNIYPKHYYDKNGLLDNYSLNQLKVDSLGGDAFTFGEKFLSSTYSRDSVMGSGPYKLVEWQPNLQIRLQKIKNYTLPKPSSNPESLTYLIVPDEATALSMLKGKQVDIVSGITPNVFNDLKKDERNDFSFHTPSIMQYYYLALNNQKEILKDKKTRRALAHLLDLYQLSKALMGGLAKPISGPVHSSKPHANKKLQAQFYDTEHAQQLLMDAGWDYDNQQGQLFKMINGRKTPLELEILVTQRELGRNLARIFKETAKTIGIEVKINSMEWGKILERMSSRNFDMIAMATRQSPGLDDFYQMWHTESIGPNGRNISGFSHPTSDSLIIAIRQETDANKRTDLYMKMQKLIYEEQPVLFLFAPTETIIHRGDMDMVISARRPGYFENTARLK